MSFADAMRKAAVFTRTENGAVALNTTGNACLDLFGTIGSLREADENRVCSLFAEAFREDPYLRQRLYFMRGMSGAVLEREKRFVLFCAIWQKSIRVRLSQIWI